MWLQLRRVVVDIQRGDGGDCNRMHGTIAVDETPYFAILDLIRVHLEVGDIGFSDAALKYVVFSKLGVDDSEFIEAQTSLIAHVSQAYDIQQKLIQHLTVLGLEEHQEKAWQGSLDRSILSATYRRKLRGHHPDKLLLRGPVKDENQHDAITRLAAIKESFEFLRNNIND
jgi:hypothetical protein